MSQAYLTVMTSSSTRCDICGEILAGVTDTALRKHAKSRAHRRARQYPVRNLVPDDTIPHTVENGTDRSSKQADTAFRPDTPLKKCSVCAAYHGTYTISDLLSVMYLDVTCIPPPFFKSPRPNRWTYPFVTSSNRNGVSRWSGEQWTVDRIVAWGCRSGNWRRLPNIDINGQNRSIDNWKHANSLLEDVVGQIFMDNAKSGNQSTCNLHSNSSHITNPSVDGTQACGAWVSFDASDELCHPKWFMKCSEDAHDLARLVPHYSNVILTMGSSMTIGLHQDTDNQFKNNVRTVGCATSRPFICTYLTVTQGTKHVLLLPPDTKKHDLEYFKRSWTGPSFLRGSLVERDSAHDDLRVFVRDDAARYGFCRLINAKGFVFRISPGLTMLIPHGWYHWLISDSQYTVTLSGSRY